MANASSTSTSSMTKPLDPEMKSRIVTHMNADHIDSLALFLQYYSKLPASQVPVDSNTGTLKMEDISLDHMIVSHPSGRNFIPIDPPMKSLSDSRERMVTMHKECLAGLDLSDLKVTHFAPPNQAWQWALHALCLFTWTALGFYRDRLNPSTGSTISKIYSFGGLVPGLARFTDRVALPVVLGMVAIHTAEATWFARTRLRKYWVPRFSPLWCVWVVCAFNGGVAGIFRFDDLVEGMRKEKEKAAKH